MDRVFIPTGNAGKLREFEHTFSALNRACIGLKAAKEVLQDQFNWNSPVEDRQTFTGNNCKKLCEAIRVLPVLESIGVNSALVDDSGLCVPRLNFLPGVHSAYLAGEPRDDAKNREFLIKKLKQELDLSGDAKEPAFFVCSLLFVKRLSDSSQVSTDCYSIDVIHQHLESFEPTIMNAVSARLGRISSAAYAVETFVEHQKQKFGLRMVMGFCTGQVATFEQQLLEGEGHGYDSLFFPNASPELSFASIPLAQKNTMSHRSEALRALNAMEKSRIAPNEIQELF